MRLILASASPRRAEILAAAGIPFETRTTNIDEERRPGESPEIMAERLAGAKAEAVALKLDVSETAIVLGADTVVVADAQVLGKPLSKAVAREMLLRLRGR
ncbi:MAG TPA: Maf family protein, partial [Candidatus Limnocylindrales bacterium]|nr:Maf family protein [Candidatus Limnocylindrales bacterium]